MDLINPCSPAVAEDNHRPMRSTAEQTERAARGGKARASDVVPESHAIPNHFAEPTWPMPDLCKLVVDRGCLANVPDFASFAGLTGSAITNGYLISSTPDEPHDPTDIFYKLRWGGQFFFASRSPSKTRSLAKHFAANGFTLELGPAKLRMAPFPKSLFTRGTHYFIARKTSLVLPGETTDRFTHFVDLIANDNPEIPDSWVVHKSIPSESYLVERFRKKFPEAPDALLLKRTRKFTEKIFPTFLTRETAFLLILQDHLPAPYNRKVPKILDMEKDERGFVTSFKMTWLRNGGPKLSQMDFAHQAADLLRVMHDIARVIHLDLRMDNMVITEEGVGFIDFGSASRVDEDLSRNPILASLFGELMQTSQIQRLLDKMTLAGHITSETIRQARGKVDRSVDFFYLALVFNSPHSNPDLAALVDYDPMSKDAQDLQQLTAQILRPKDTENPAFRSAKDILHGIERIRLNLDRRGVRKRTESSDDEEVK